MNKNIISFILFLLFSSPLIMDSEELARKTVEFQPIPAEVEEILSLSGTDSQLKSFSLLISENMKHYSVNLRPELAGELDDAMKNAYSFDVIAPEYRRAFADNISTKALPKIKTWLESDLGKKVTRLETAAMAPESSESFRKYMPETLSLSEKRKELVSKYLETTFSEKYSAKFASESIRRLMLSIQKNLPEDLRMNQKIFNARSAAIEKEAVFQYTSMLPASTAFTYRELDDDEFTGMLGFYGSPEGVEMIKASWKALIAAVDAASENAGLGLAGILKRASEKRRSGAVEPQ